MMNFWKSAVDIVDRIFTEERTQPQQYQSEI